MVLSPGPVFYLCLRTCLETVLAKTVLRHVLDRWRCRFSICLRQKIVLQIRIQVLVNTLAPIKYLISQYRDRLSRHGDFHYEDKTVSPSYLYNGNPTSGKTVLTLRRDPGFNHITQMANIVTYSGLIRYHSKLVR